MARQKLIHIHSVAKNSANDGPKLPTSDQIEYGEIAVNYLKDNETISIKNSYGEIKSLSLNAPFFFNTNGKGGIETALSKGGASGDNSHAEGKSTTASGNQSHAEGKSTTASGIGSHAEGENTTASDKHSHAEGENTTASGGDSHAEGNLTTASGNNSHTEGYQTIASGNNSHAEGSGSFAVATECHSEGLMTVSGNGYSHAEGGYTYSYGYGSHCEGHSSKMFIGLKGVVTDADAKTFTLYVNEAKGYFYCSEEEFKTVWPYISNEIIPTLFRCGERYFYDSWDTLKEDMDSNIRTNAIVGLASVSANDPAYNPFAKALIFTEDFSSIDGRNTWDKLFEKFTTGKEFYVIWELNSVAFATGSHTEGEFGVCGGSASHCGGFSNVCNGIYSFVGGEGCVNQTNGAMVYGQELINHTNSPYSTTIGKYNEQIDNGLFIIGNGSGTNNRKNALTITSGGLFQTSAAWTTSSDVRLKNVIDDTISVDVNKVAEMPVFTYTRKDLEKSQTMIGSSAQYWQEILPESVKEDENGYLSLDYNGVLLSCVKSLANTVEAYKSEIEILKKEIEELKGK